jgi:hypothetical protein
VGLRKNEVEWARFHPGIIKDDYSVEFTLRIAFSEGPKHAGATDLLQSMIDLSAQMIDAIDAKAREIGCSNERARRA